MINRFVFDISPHNTMRVWTYFDEEDFHSILNSPMRFSFDFMSCWNGYDKRESGMISWEFPLSLATFFFERYCTDSRADTEYLRSYLGK